MPLQGRLKEMSLANLIQVSCQEMRAAHLTVAHEGQTGEIYFSDGQVVHAAAGARVGEEAVYEMLAWDDGTFTLEKDVYAPEKSVHAKWPELLLEGMKHAAEWKMDERGAERPVTPDALGQPKASEGVAGAVIAASDGVVFAADVPESGGERPMTPDALAQLKAIEGVVGAVIAASDGVVLAADVPESDGEREAAVAVFVGGAANQIGEALQLDPFEHGVAVSKKNRILVLKQPDRYVGLVLGDRASPAMVANAAGQILK